MEDEILRLDSVRVEASDPICQEAVRRNGHNVSSSLTLKELLKRPHVHYDILHTFNHASPDTVLSRFFSFNQLVCVQSLTKADEETVEIGIKYEGFIRRQTRQVEYMKARGNKPIPEDIDYPSISKLSSEAREHLQRIRPKNIGQASMIGGVSPADITALLIYLEVRRRKEQKSRLSTAIASD